MELWQPRSQASGEGSIHLNNTQPTTEQTQKKQPANSELGIWGKGSGVCASLSPLVCTSEVSIVLQRTFKHQLALVPQPRFVLSPF